MFVVHFILDCILFLHDISIIIDILVLRFLPAR